MDGSGLVVDSVMALSGGMDSTSLLLHLLANGDSVTAISFEYGQKHSLELERAKLNIAYLKECHYEVNHIIIDLTSAMSSFHSALITEEYPMPEGHYEEEQMKQTVVPNRNAIFSSILYGHALSQVEKKGGSNVRVCLGVHSGDHAIYPDCRPEFYNSLMESFRLGNWNSEKVELYLPYVKGDKYSILKDAENSISTLDLEFDIIFRNTNTSYNPTDEGKASGKSGADIERILAFHKLGVADPVEYVEPWETVLAHALNIEKSYQLNEGE